MLFNNVILAALPLSLCVAAPSERQAYVGEGVSCKVRGDHQNVRPYAFLQDKTVPACRKLCKRDADCRSFATYKHACRLYDVSVRANVEESADGPWTFYDKTCSVGHERRQASGSSTTRSTISTTTSRTPAPSTTTSRTPAPSTTTSRTTVSTTTRPGSTSNTATTTSSTPGGGVSTSSSALASSVATTVVDTSAATTLSNTVSNAPPVVSTSLLTSASLSVSSTFVTVSNTAGSASSSTIASSGIQQSSSALTTLPVTSVTSPSTTAVSSIERSSSSVVVSSSAPGSSSSISLSPSSDSASIVASSSTTIPPISSTLSTSSLPATTSGSEVAQREVRNVKLIIGSSSANKRAAPRYLSRLLSADGSRGLTDNPDDALLIAFAFPLGSTQPVPQLNLFTLNSASDLNYPFLSMVMQAADAASAIIGSNVASIVAFGASQATAPGATPQSVGNSVGDRDTSNSYFVESAIWTVDPLTFAIKATWVNPDGQPTDLTLVTNGDAVGLTAAPQLFSGWQSVSMAADVPPNDGADTTTSGLAVISTSDGQVQVSSTTAIAPTTTIDTQPVTTSDALPVSTTDAETSSSELESTTAAVTSETTTAAITSETSTEDAPVTSSQTEAVVTTSTTASVTTTTSGPSADVVCCFDITPGMCPNGQNGAELYNPGVGYSDANTCGQGCFNDPRCIGWQYSTRFGCSFWNAGSDGAGTFAPYYNSGQCRDNTVAVKRPACGSVCGAPTTTLAVAPSTSSSPATTTSDVDQSTSTTTVESDESSSANGTPAVSTTTTSAAVVSTPGPIDGVGACGVRGDPINDLGEISNAFVTSVQSCARSCWSNTNCASYSIDQTTAVDARKRTIFYTCRLLRAPFASNIAANDNGDRTYYSRSCAAPISTLCGAKANPTTDLSMFDTQLVPNLAQCAAMCVQRRSCQSYSITDSNGGFDGWAKRDTTTTYRCSMYTDAFEDRATADPSSSTTFYDRSCAPAPPTTLNMVCNAEGSVPQTDLQFIDQTITDADTCYSSCIANPSCRTYSFRRIDLNGDFSGYCTLFAQQIQYSDFYYFPTRNYFYQRDCAPPSEFAFKQYSGNIAGTFEQFQGPYCNKQIVMVNDMEKIYDTNMFTQQACGNACLAQTYCQSFSFDQTSNICTLFGDPLAEYASPGTTGPIFSERECLTITTTTTTTLAVQTTTTTTTTAAATTTAAHVCAQNGRTASGFYSYWNRQLQTPAQCQAYCAADSQCQAFSVYTVGNSNPYCDLYSHPLPASYHPDPSSVMIWTERACFVSGDASATTTAAPPAGTPGPMLCDAMGRQGSLFQLGYEQEVDNLAGCKARCSADVLCRSYSFSPPRYQGDNQGNQCSIFSSALSDGFEQWERLDGTYYYDLACDLNATPTTTTISRTKPIMDKSSMPQVPIFRAPADAPSPIPSDYPPIDSSATRYCDGMDNGPYNVTWWDQSVDDRWVEFDVRCSTLMDWTGTVVERRSGLGFAGCMEYCRVKGSDCDAVMWGDTLDCAILAFSDRQLYASNNNAFAKRIAWGAGWNDEYMRKRSLKTIG